MFTLQFSQRTDTGKIRQNNEDFIWVTGAYEDTKGILFILADGLGGLEYGEVASRQAAHALTRLFCESEEKPDSAWFVEAFSKISREIFDLSGKMGVLGRMATTLTASLFYREALLIAHAGDCRVYRIRQGRMACLTKDHSAGRHILTRCLGTHPQAEADVYEHTIAAGDIYLQCSDGLYPDLAEADLSRIISKKAPEEACEGLIQLANEAGGQDNISVQIVRVDA